MTRQTPATPPPSTSRLRSSLHAERQQALIEKEEERTSVPRYAGPLLPPVGHERSLMACDFLTLAVASFERVLEEVPFGLSPSPRLLARGQARGPTPLPRRPSHGWPG